VIGTAARLHRQKGLDVLLRAAAQLPGVSFVIIGSGPERENLGQLAEELALNDRVHFIGWQERRQDYLADVDIFALPSRFEALPLSIIEAMQLGLPVVVSAVGGNAELVVDGDTGILVPPEDVDALVAGLRTLLDDSALRKRMGERGRKRALEQFSLDRMVRAYEALYDELLAGVSRWRWRW
jgi:glycosyltransferase involved in cell wall biosynthesis